MFKKVTAAIAAVALTGAGFFGIASAASATTPDCVPSAAVAAYDETVLDSAAYDETITDAAAYDETVLDSAAVDRWYSWTGGPGDDHSFPLDSWNPDNGNHNGFPQDAGVYQRDKGHSGNSDWFYHEVADEVTHVVHHEAVVRVVHHDAITHVVHHDAVPAVTCDPAPPTETPVPTPTPTPTETPEPTETPVPIPTPTETPIPTETPVLTPTVTTTPAPVVLASDDIPTTTVLAHTGSNIGDILIIALALSAVGGLLVVIGRDVRARRKTK